MYDYICLRCGRRLYPEAQTEDSKASVLYDLSPVLGLTEHRRFPAYFTHDEMRTLVRQHSDGSNFVKVSLTLSALMNIIANRLDEPEIKDTTFTHLTALTEAYEKLTFAMEQEGNDFLSELAPEESSVIEETEAPAEPAFDYNTVPLYRAAMRGSRVVGDQAIEPVYRFCKSLIALFMDDIGQEKPYSFEIKINLDRIGEEGTTIGYQYKDENGIAVKPECAVICGEKSCWHSNDGNHGAPVPDQAWRYEHIAIGFIGAPNSGKTCLITALLDKMLKLGCQLVTGDKRDMIRDCLTKYDKNTVLPKTAAEGSNCFNVSVLHNDKMITLVDISGECFDFDTGTFNQNRAQKSFRMIQFCRCYVLCLDPQNDLYRTGGLAATAIGQFVDFLVSGTNGLQYAAPILLTMTKCDCQPDLQFEDYDKKDEEIKRNVLANESNFQNFLKKSCDYVKAHYGAFFANAGSSAYIAAALCSAYGCEPKPDDTGLASLAQLRADAGERKLYLTSNGEFYLTNDAFRSDFPVGADYVNRKFYHRDGVFAYSDVPPEGEGWLCGDMSALRFTVKERSHDNLPISGEVFREDHYESLPHPINLGMITRWLMRICGITPLMVEVENDAGMISGFENYLLQPGERWDRTQFKYRTPALAVSAVRMFANPTSDDRKVSDHRDNRLTLMGMGLLDSIGIRRWRSKKLDD